MFMYIWVYKYYGQDREETLPQWWKCHAVEVPWKCPLHTLVLYPTEAAVVVRTQLHSPVASSLSDLGKP